jgi:predicted amidohydrolase
MKVALITEVFFNDRKGIALRDHLTRAVDQGADVAVLPELPLSAWAPFSKVVHDEDAEPDGGPRQETMCQAAADVGIALVGGAIIRDADSGTRYNTALLYAADGSCIARYRKVHLPEEEGYWETSHYEPGDQGPEVIGGLPMKVGLQICSDVNRPQGFQLLAAQGAQVIFAPRATPPETYDRWRLILRANAIMTGAYVISTNRPRPERGASIGGPSIAIAPTGEVIAETTDPVCVVETDPAVVTEAGAEYPGYLERFPALYAKSWSRLEG